MKKEIEINLEAKLLLEKRKKNNNATSKKIQRSEDEINEDRKILNEEAKELLLNYNNKLNFL